LGGLGGGLGRGLGGCLGVESVGAGEQGCPRGEGEDMGCAHAPPSYHRGMRCFHEFAA
jgi:hypothetical protein